MAIKKINKTEEKILSSLPKYLQSSVVTSLQDISIPYVCQIFEQNDNHNWHINDYYIFVYCLQGNKQLSIGENKIIIKPGEGIILPANILHRFYSSKKEVKVMLFCFYASSTKKYVENISGEIFVPNKEERKILFEAINSFAILQDKRETSLHFSIALYRIIKRVFSTFTDEFYIEHSDKIIHQANLLIQANLHKKITLLFLSKSLNISISSLQKKFYAKMKCGVGRYILTQRLNKASKLLRSSNMNLSEIAFAIGFESEITFSRAFKRETGYTPTQIRKIARGNFEENVKLQLNGFPIQKDN